MKIKHDVWKDPEGLTMLCFSDELGEESRTLLDPNSKIIHSFYADSHFEAMSKYYEFMNWGKYETEFEVDKLPYSKENTFTRAKIRKGIDKILWEDWDPIELNNNSLLRDEYQNYVQIILNMVDLLKSSIEEIAEKLYYLETEIMGLTGNKEKCLKVAEKIKNIS